MKTLHTALVLAALTLSATATLAPATAAAQEATGITWNTDVMVGFREAMKENKPLVIYFYMEGCDWCDKLENGAFASEGFRAYASKAVFVKLNQAEDDAGKNVSRLLTDLKIEKFPHLSVLDCTAAEIKERNFISGHFVAETYVPKFAAIVGPATAAPLTAEAYDARLTELTNQLGAAGTDLGKFIQVFLAEGTFDAEGFAKTREAKMAEAKKIHAEIGALGVPDSEEARALHAALVKMFVWEEETMNLVMDEVIRLATPADVVAGQYLATLTAQQKVRKLLEEVAEANTTEISKVGTLREKFYTAHGITQGTMTQTETVEEAPSPF